MKMNLSRLNELKESCKKYGQVFELDEKYLHVSNIPEHGHCVCYGPLALFRTLVGLDQLGIVACTEEDEGEISYIGFECKDNYGDIYTTPLFNSVEQLKQFIKDPSLQDREDNILGVELDRNWKSLISE